MGIYVPEGIAGSSLLEELHGAMSGVQTRVSCKLSRGGDHAKDTIELVYWMQGGAQQQQHSRDRPARLMPPRPDLLQHRPPSPRDSQQLPPGAQTNGLGSPSGPALHRLFSHEAKNPPIMGPSRVRKTDIIDVQPLQGHKNLESTNST